MSKLTVTKLNDEGRKWYQIDGECPDTGVSFDNETFAVTDDNEILDADGCPLTSGDSQTIAVENAIEQFVRDQEKQSPPSGKTNKTEYAFPHTYDALGMTLRDYFAAKALQGLIAENLEDDDPHGKHPDTLAAWAYKYADAMLNARK